jgi:hypothetical protein
MSLSSAINRSSISRTPTPKSPEGGGTERPSRNPRNRFTARNNGSNTIQGRFFSIPCAHNVSRCLFPNRNGCGFTALSWPTARPRPAAERWAVAAV